MNIKELIVYALPYKWVVKHTLRRLTKDLVVYRKYPNSSTWGAFVNTDKWDVGVKKETKYPLTNGILWVREVVLTLKQDKNISLVFSLNTSRWFAGEGGVIEDFVNEENIVDMVHFVYASNRVKLSPNILRDDRNIDQHITACFWQQEVYNAIPRVLDNLNEKEAKKRLREQHTQNNKQARKNIASILSSIK